MFLLKRLPSVLATALGLGLWVVSSSCADIFHRFDGLANACGSTESCNACVPLVPEQAPLQAALHACSWLGACELPIGQAAFGKCILQATLAFDCKANPNNPPRDALARYWTALAKSSTCEDVRAATSGGRIACPSTGEGISCVRLNNGDPYDSAANARVDCSANATLGAGERCLVTGQQCAGVRGDLSVGSLCLGSDGESCRGNRCEGTHKHLCRTNSQGISLDMGKNCRFFGAQTCDNGEAGPTCRPASDEACAATRRVRCEGATALSCAAGLVERVDCAALPGGFQCIELDLQPGEETVDACRVQPTPNPSPSAEIPVEAERCADKGTVVVSRYRGADLRVSCPTMGLGPCEMVTTSEGPRARCSAPSP